MEGLFGFLAGIMEEEWVLLIMELVIFAILVAGIVLALMLAMRMIAVTAKRIYKRDDDQRQTALVVKNLIARTVWFTPYAVAGLIALAIHSPLSDKLETTLRVLCLSLLFIQAGIWAAGLLNLWLERGMRALKVSEQAATSATGVVRFFALVVIWSILLLTILGNMGIQIGPLIAGLGVGGIAIAFALQKILGDVFCSVAIILDKPFEVGDFIIVDPGNMGTVERIGIKTTRVRSLTGEQIIFSNADLLDARLHNFKRMSERRAVFGIGVVYQTPVEVLEQIVPRVKQIIEEIEKARYDRGHLKEFGASSYNFEFVYYVLERDMSVYLGIQQRINFAIIRLLDELGTEFAYPTQTLHIDSVPPPQSIPTTVPE